MLCYYGDDMEEYRRLCNLGIQVVDFDVINCMELAQNRDHWKALFNVPLHLQVT